MVSLYLTLPCRSLSQAVAETIECGDTVADPNRGVGVVLARRDQVRAATVDFGDRGTVEVPIGALIKLHGEVQL